MIHQSKAEIIGYLLISMTFCCALKSVRHYDDYFFNMDFSITIAYIGFKFCLYILRICMEGSVSQICLVGPSFLLMTKFGKHFVNLRTNFF